MYTDLANLGVAMVEEFHELCEVSTISQGGEGSAYLFEFGRHIV